ncbi:MAG: acetyl-CoA carboxylase biotin carboxylase subunit [Bacteroidales bacterium]|nr:acetyl-CoA carboxylase biotin carboxylase subunit [Bacteroidales bacterium]
MDLFKKILIANRGEIAVRVIRAVQDLNIRAVAIYSEADMHAMHVLMADEAYYLGGNDLAETYLNIPKIIDIAQKCRAQAIHPGYGFLSENPKFVEACDKAGIVFIGPNARAMKLMGNKIESREALKDAGIPMTAGITGDMTTLLKRAGEIPFPIMIKAAAGGGGKGMRIAHDDTNLAEVLESTSREAKNYFGDGTVFIEKYIEEPRHIEIQVLGDNHGNVIHLFERECSIQRRHQKIIEESPSPTLTPEVREKMGETAVRIAKEIGYNSAGTVEFLVDKDLHFFFLEMNTRVQVEHPVTELVTGIDIVKEQIFIAAGKPLDLEQDLLVQYGHAIECRIYAEDPVNNFLPSPGEMTYYLEPEGEDIRIDTGIMEATTIHSFYDPLICKLVVWGETREEARVKMTGALKHFIIHGISTNIAYLRQLMDHQAYISNNFSTKFCDEHSGEIIDVLKKEQAETPVHIPGFAYFLYDFSCRQTGNGAAGKNIWNHIGYWRGVMDLEGTVEDKPFRFTVEKAINGAYLLTINDKKHTAFVRICEEGYLEVILDEQQLEFFVSSDDEGNGYVTYLGHIFGVKRTDVLGKKEILGSFDAHGGKSDGRIVSPMPGRVIKINVRQGEEVKKGQTLLIVEAMKMENNIVAPVDGKVEKVNVKVGEMVNSSTSLVQISV